jgi:hypothetical protein
LLPDPFKDLEPFVSSWALAKEAERNRKRLSSTMEEIRAFYQALLPRMEAIIAYLNRFPLEEMPEDARRLFYLTLSLAEISPAVELYGEPGVIDGFESARFVPVRD